MFLCIVFNNTHTYTPKVQGVLKSKGGPLVPCSLSSPTVGAARSRDSFWRPLGCPSKKGTRQNNKQHIAHCWDILSFCWWLASCFKKDHHIFGLPAFFQGFHLVPMCLVGSRKCLPHSLHRPGGRTGCFPQNMKDPSFPEKRAAQFLEVCSFLLSPLLFFLLSLVLDHHNPGEGGVAFASLTPRCHMSHNQSPGQRRLARDYPNRK